MDLYKNKYRTDSPRLDGWDYRTPAWYFVTICTQNRHHFFGKIRHGIMGLSEIGNIAHRNWAAIPDHFDHAALGEWIVMPNHVHGLIRIMDWPVQNNDETVETCHGMSLRFRGHGMSLHRDAQLGKPQSGSLSVIINQYKSSVTRWVRKNDNTDFAWQARFYDHIVRDNRSLDRIQAYIAHNPQKWEEDRYHGIN